MKALLDTNVLISYLLAPKKETSVVLLFKKIGQGEVELLLTGEIIDELSNAVAKKKYLSDRVSNQQVKDFIDFLYNIDKIVPELKLDLFPISRDIKDDYLLAYALVGGATFLVTGDEDLLALNPRVKGLEIVTPKTLVKYLD